MMMAYMYMYLWRRFVTQPLSSLSLSRHLAWTYKHITNPQIAMISPTKNVVRQKLKVGLLGFGSLGQYLYDAIMTDEKVSSMMEVQYVWNRSAKALDEKNIPRQLRLNSLDEAASRGADIVVEVSHPVVSKKVAVSVMKSGGNFVVGSPTAFADPDTESAIRHTAASQSNGYGGVYIPVGALVGASDLQSLANRGGLASLTVTMKKHPAMLNLNDDQLNEHRLRMIEEEQEYISRNQTSQLTEQVLFEGSVRDLCPKAPNNVNTMACAAMAAHTLGFDNTVGRLVADARLTTHEVEILAMGHPNEMGMQFKLHICRSSPAPVGAVTSKATYGSFLESIIKCHGLGPGVHFV